MSFLPSYTVKTHGSNHASLNPNEIKTVTKMISIDSSFRDNYHTTESTDHTVIFPEPINNVISLRLSSLELPNMWFMFSEHNNSNIFYIETNFPNNTGDAIVGVTGVSQIHTIVIPEGNYLASYFEEMLNDYFKGHGNGLQYLHCTIDVQRGKMIFRAKNNSVDDEENPFTQDNSFNFTVTFKVNDVPYNQTAGWMMGFKEESYHIVQADEHVDYTQVVDGSDNIAGDGIEEQDDGNDSIGGEGKSFPKYQAYLCSEATFGANMIQYVFVDIDDFQKNHAPHSILHVKGDRYLGQNILGKAVVNSGQFTNLIVNSSDMMFRKRTYFGPVRLEKLRVRILDRFGDVVYLNNNDFSLSLEIEQIYSR